MLLCEDDDLHATWSRFGPGRDGADLHVHHHHTDMSTCSRASHAPAGPAGEEVAAPRARSCASRRSSSTASATRAMPIRFLNLHMPGMGFAAYMRDLRDGRRAAYDQHDRPPTAAATLRGAHRPPSGEVEGARRGAPRSPAGLRARGRARAGGRTRAAAGAWVDLDGAQVLAAPARYLGVRP